MTFRTLPSGLCALCGGARRAGRASHTVDLGTTVVVDAIVAQLERIVHEARARGVQVEVVSLP